MAQHTVQEVPADTGRQFVNASGGGANEGRCAALQRSLPTPIILRFYEFTSLYLDISALPDLFMQGCSQPLLCPFRHCSVQDAESTILIC